MLSYNITVEYADKTKYLDAVIKHVKDIRQPITEEDYYLCRTALKYIDVDIVH